MTFSRVSGETTYILLPRGGHGRKERAVGKMQVPSLPSPCPSRGIWGIGVTGKPGHRELERCGKAAGPEINQPPQPARFPRVSLLPGVQGAGRAPGEAEFPLQWEPPHLRHPHQPFSPPLLSHCSSNGNPALPSSPNRPLTEQGLIQTLPVFPDLPSLPLSGFDSLLSLQPIPSSADLSSSEIQPGREQPRD